MIKQIKIIETCFNDKVIPVILVMNHTLGHFYGAQHGDLSQALKAMLGPDMRARLDFVHQQLGLPRLGATPYDADSLADDSLMEEASILDIWALTSTPVDVMPRIRK